MKLFVHTSNYYIKSALTEDYKNIPNINQTIICAIEALILHFVMGLGGLSKRLKFHIL